MDLIIKKVGEKQVSVKFSDNELKINEQSSDWNIEGINKFLINLASKTPDGERIKIIFDDNEQDEIYKHILFLFKSFCDEYNRKIENNK